MQIPLDIYCGNLALNFDGTPFEIFRAIQRRIRASIPGSRVIIGFSGTTGGPNYNQGPWFLNVGFGNSQMWAFNAESGRYEPTVKQIGSGGGFEITLATDELSASTRNVSLPDSSGTPLMWLAAVVPRATVILQSGSNNISWADSGEFVKRLIGNVTLTMSGAVNGQKVTVVIENNSTNFTVTWATTGIRWSAGGTPPVQPVSVNGSTAVGLYTFRKINGLIYGSLTETQTLPNPTVIDPGGPDSVTTGTGAANYKAPTNYKKFPY